MTALRLYFSEYFSLTTLFANLGVGFHFADLETGQLGQEFKFGQ